MAETADTTTTSRRSILGIISSLPVAAIGPANAAALSTPKPSSPLIALSRELNAARRQFDEFFECDPPDDIWEQAVDAAKCLRKRLAAVRPKDFEDLRLKGAAIYMNMEDLDHEVAEEIAGDGNCSMDTVALSFIRDFVTLYGTGASLG